MEIKLFFVIFIFELPPLFLLQFLILRLLVLHTFLFLILVCLLYLRIVHYHYEDEDNKLIVTDLLADVIVYPDGFVKVVDIDEMVDCLDNNKISIDQLKESLVQLDKLLSLIYAGDFEKLTRYIEVLE